MRRLAAVALGGGLAFAALAGACATSGGDAEPQGPVYMLDGGTNDPSDDAHATNDHDGTTSPDDGGVGTDATKPGDAAGSGDPGDTGTDAGEPGDAADASSATSPDCGAEIAVLAGSASSLSGAVATGTGPFTVHAITGGSASLTPALVPTGGGFQALVAMSGDAGGGYPLFGLGYAGSTWSTPAALGSSASAIDAPAVALLGSNVEGVYLNPEYRYFHAEWAGASWNAGTDPVEVGSTQSIGPVRASAAATATELVIAYQGYDGHLYAQSWTSGGPWQASVPIAESDAGFPLATNTPPTIVALTPGGTEDFLVVYDAPANPPSEQHIYYAVRTASTKAWSTPVMISAAIYSPAAPALAAMSGGRALLGWEGGNGLAYTSEYDPTPTPAWTTAVSISSATVTVPPSLATGICGGDAVAAIVSGGTVSVAKYATGAWGAPASLAGIGGAQVASVATAP